MKNKLYTLYSNSLSFSQDFTDLIAGFAENEEILQVISDNNTSKLIVITKLTSPRDAKIKNLLKDELLR